MSAREPDAGPTGPVRPDGPSSDPGSTEVCVPEADGSCSLCGDEGWVGRVVEVPRPGVARVRREDGVGEAGGREVATDLVEPVTAGDALVVHLGFAIAKVREAS